MSKTIEANHEEARQLAEMKQGESNLARAYLELRAEAERAKQAVSKMVIDHAVNRFLGWILPADFAPDCGISFKRESDYEHPKYGRTKYEPAGINLFTADQARAMFEHCLAPHHHGITLSREDAEDAQRYRFLKATGSIVTGWMPDVPIEDVSYDAVIDAAMEKQRTALGEQHGN